MKRALSVVILIVVLCSLFGQAQQTGATGANVVVPTLVQFSGALTGSNGKPLTSITGVTFSLYAEQAGSAPLWLETQNVQPNSTGQYSVMLGLTTSQGLPSTLFVSGQARWLEVQAQGQEPQPRIMLLSVPYALKAGDAQTLGGLPPSAFALNAPRSADVPAAVASANAPSRNVKPPVGGTGTEDYVPLWTDNNGDLGNSVIYQSGAGSSAKVGVNTTKPKSTLDVDGKINADSGYNLGGKPFAFGNFLNQNAFLGFAGGPSVTASDDTAVGFAALSQDTGSGYNTAVGESALFYNATGGFNTASGAAVLFLNTTGSYNTASGYSALYANTTGGLNTANGNSAMEDNTTGGGNTASGAWTLSEDTTGSYNTGVGIYAGQTLDRSAMTESNNTFLGAGSAASTGSLSNATAIGSNAEVTASNAMVLGSINGTNGATADTYVGIGTTAPTSVLTVSGVDSSANGFAASIKLANTASGGANWYLRTGATGTNTPAGGFSLANDNSYWMTINGGNGDVGLGGLTSPSHPLTMADGAYEDSGAWTNASDRNLKEAFQPVDEASLLTKLNTIPMQTWRYKSESAAVRHLGPMAQDFHAAFALGQDDKHISTVDEGGVALAAIQQLYREGLKKDAQIRAQQAQIRSAVALAQTQRVQIAQLMSQVKAIQASLKTNGRTGAEVRTVKTQVATVQQ